MADIRVEPQTGREGGSDLPALAAHGVEVRHGSRRVLGPVDLAVRTGETVALLGPNGSGKTSLLRVLAGISSPDAGHATLAGRRLRDIRPRERARLIASVAQDEHTDLPFTARDVLLLGRSVSTPEWRPYRDEDHAAIEQLARRWEVEGLLDRPLRDMSGGERRRVLIARAFAQQADLILLDEPTNHLDLRHQHDLLGHLADSPATCVVALHDIDLAATYCSRVVLLHEGMIVADGTPAEVIRADLVERIYRVPARDAEWEGRSRIVVGR